MNPHTNITTEHLLNQLEPKRKMDLINRSHPLKQCDYKDHKAEAISGIGFKGKWICGTCWPIFLKKGFQ